MKTNLDLIQHTWPHDMKTEKDIATRKQGPTRKLIIKLAILPDVKNKKHDAYIWCNPQRKSIECHGRKIYNIDR